MENLSEDSIKERSDLSHVDGNEPSDVERRSNDDSDCTTKHEQDADMTKDNNYSHVAKTEEIRISGPGNLKIFDDTDTDTTVNREAQIDHVSGDPIENESDTDKSKYQDNSNVDTEASNTGEIKGSEDGTTEKIGEEDETKQKTDDEDNAKVQENLAKLRQKQTHDEEEDYEIDYEAAYNRAGEKYEYFWKGQDIYSQWHKSWFYVDNKKFNCAEQFMMFKKAELFEDEKIASEVLRCKDPKKMKALGREVRGFDPDVWQQHCLYIVKEGNKAKFMQNQDMLADLLLTSPKLLVEASPYDNIWGIGLDEDSPDAWDINTWQGKNYLGYVITEVRDDIMVEQGMIEEKDREKYIDNLLVAAGYSADTDKTYRQEEREKTISNTKETPEHNEDNKSSPERAEYRDTKEESYLVFFGGIFSQFYNAYFEVNDIEYNCAEQYMMYHKAVLFNDYRIAEEILKTNNPVDIKRLGRKVKGFDNKTWQHHCLRLVKEGSMAKFSQNERLKKAIVETYPKVLVEANPHDKIWGIGLEANDPMSQNKNSWQGKNFLGYVLTEARDELMYQWHLIKKEERRIYIEKLHELWVTPVDDRSHYKDKDNKYTGAKRGRGRNDRYERPKNQNDDQHRRNVNQSTGKRNDGAFENEFQHKKGRLDYGKGEKGNENWFHGQGTSSQRYHDNHNDYRHTEDRFYHAHGSNQRTNDRDHFAKDAYQHQGDNQHANQVPKTQTEYRERDGNGQQTHGSKNYVQSDSNETWEEVSGRNKKQRNRNQSERSDESGVHKAEIEDDGRHAGGKRKPEKRAEHEKKSNKPDKSGQVTVELADKGNRQGGKTDQPSHSTKAERKTENQSKSKKEIAIDDFDLNEMMEKFSDKSSALPSPKEEKENPTGKKSKHQKGSPDHAAQKGGEAKAESVTADQGGSSKKKGKSRKKRK